MNQLTMDGLRKAMTDLGSHWEKYIPECVDPDGVMSDEEAVEKFVNDMCNEEILHYINTHMQVVPSLQLSISDCNISDIAMTDEANFPGEVKYIEKLYSGIPLCEVGYDSLSCGIHTLMYWNNVHTYISADGRLLIAMGHAITNDEFVVEHLHESKKKCYCLDNLNDIVDKINEDYKELWTR